VFAGNLFQSHYASNVISGMLLWISNASVSEDAMRQYTTSLGVTQLTNLNFKVNYIFFFNLVQFQPVLE
jgi:hypothetical protein